MSLHISVKYTRAILGIIRGEVRNLLYILVFYCRVGDQQPKWYKFDDGEVSECKMDDDEEMKNQCFGGEYLGEVFDHMLKRYEPSVLCEPC